ncbi:MAG: hypothetical protein O3C40_32920 [Planctomycetota bacterium]|nr:hypothetical protein [Planctomycetota bacterium]
MPRTVRMVSGLLMVCLAYAFVLADEPPPQQEAAPAAKKAAAKRAEAKKDDAKEKKRKAKAPAGYEDAPEAGDPPQARNVAAAEVVVEAMEVQEFEAVGENIAQFLAGGANAEVLQLEKQLLPQFTPLATAELSFIHRACDLNLEQRKKIKAASDTCVKVAARRYAMAQRGMMIGRSGRSQPTVPDPAELLHQALAKVLEETLQEEQQTVYAAEMEKRRAFRKRVAIDNTVAAIDERLVLTIDQRQQLTETLDKNWQPSWVQSMEMQMNNNQYLPSIPDQFVVPVLSETQKQVWRAAQKHNYAVWSGLNWARQGAVLDDFPLVENEAVVEREPAN